MTEATSAADVTPSPFAGGDWFDPLEEAVRLQVRGFIEELLEEELEAALGRGRYERSSAGKGHRHGRRTRQLVTTFGPLELSVPRQCAQKPRSLSRPNPASRCSTERAPHSGPTNRQLKHWNSSINLSMTILCRVVQTRQRPQLGAAVARHDRRG